MYDQITFTEHVKIAGEDEKPTHVQFFSYKELSIKGNESQFYKDYCAKTAHLQYMNENENPIYPNYGEIYEGIVPVVVRMHLRFKGEFDRIDDELFILHMVKESQNCISKLFECNPDKNNPELIPELLACYFEGVPYYHAGETVIQYRIQFPWCRTKYENVLFRFYPLLMEKVRENDLLQHLPPILRESLNIGWNEIINPNEMRAPLPLYYSVTDKLESCAYLHHIFPTLPANLDDYKYEEDVRPHFFSPEDHAFFTETYKPTEHGEPQDLYPLFFSIYYGDWETPCIPENEMLPKTPMPIFEKENKGVCNRGRYLDISKKMLEILKEDKTLMINFKEVIGRSIYGADLLDNSRPSKEGEALFMEIKRFVDEENFNTRKTRIEYKDMRYQPLTYTYKTLCYLVKMFMKDRYVKWHEEWYRTAFMDAQRNVKEGLRLAEMIYRVLFLDFIVAEFKKGIWYSFDGNVWRENDSTSMIDKKIIEEIRPIIERRIGAHIRERDKELDDRRKKDYTMDIEAMEKLEQKLSTNKGISDMVGLLKKLFYDENFSKNKNKNIYVTGVRNGVLEAKATQLYFRLGLPEDYITKQCNVFYERISPAHPNREFLMNWFRQMWPEPIVHWYLKYKASNFIGRNLNKIFLFITGGVDNGKSQLVLLNQCLFGEYFVDIDAAAFSKRKQSASQATEEWEDARDTRDMNINEPSEGFISDMLKKIAGGDKFRSRGNYEKGGMVDSTFKITATMNQLIDLEGDKAMRRRTRILETKCTYVEEKYLPKTEEEQKRRRIFKMDPDLSNKIPLLADAYLAILEDYYVLYKKEGLDTPKEMQVVIDRYWKQYDYISKFADEFMDTRDMDGTILDENTQVSIQELYHLFEGWFRSLNPHKTVPVLNKFRYILNQTVPMNEEQTMCLGVRNKKSSNNVDMEGLM